MAAPELPQQFGPYTLVELIARGGMAEIFRATMPGVGGFEKTVAIKKILPHLAENDEFITMLIDEARIIVSINHANIAQVYDLGEIQDDYYIAMEYIHGIDLSTIVKELKESNRTVPVEHALFIASGIAAGLHVAHNKCDDTGRPLNIVHRDVSPHNILISYAGDVKIIDFGVAKARGKEAHTQLGVIKGKLLYMAPEQAMAKELDGRADLFAMGLILYRMLTNHLPFEGDNEFQIYNHILSKEITPPRAFNPNISEEVNQIIMMLLQRDPSKRYQDGYSAKVDLDRALQSAAPGYSISRLSRWVEDEFSHLIQRRMAKSGNNAMPPSTPSHNNVTGGGIGSTDWDDDWDEIDEDEDTINVSMNSPEAQAILDKAQEERELYEQRRASGEIPAPEPAPWGDQPQAPWPDQPAQSGQAAHPQQSGQWNQPQPQQSGQWNQPQQVPAHSGPQQFQHAAQSGQFQQSQQDWGQAQSSGQFQAAPSQSGQYPQQHQSGQYPQQQSQQPEAFPAPPQPGQPQAQQSGGYPVSQQGGMNASGAYPTNGGYPVNQAGAYSVNQSGAYPVNQSGMYAAPNQSGQYSTPGASGMYASPHYQPYDGPSPLRPEDAGQQNIDHVPQEESRGLVVKVIVLLVLIAVVGVLAWQFFGTSSTPEPPPDEPTAEGGEGTPVAEPVAEPAEPAEPEAAVAGADVGSEEADPEESGREVTFTAESEPEGADVYVNDKLIGQTPFKEKIPWSEDETAIRFELEGHATESLEAIPFDNFRRSVELMPVSGEGEGEGEDAGASDNEETVKEAPKPKKKRRKRRPRKRRPKPKPEKKDPSVPLLLDEKPEKKPAADVPVF